MPITQQIGSSSLSKPGVCTSTTRPSSPYNGQLVWETDTGKSFIWNGSSWVLFSAPNPPTVSLYNTTDQALSGPSYNILSFNSERWDTHGMHSTSSNTSRITIPSGWDGYYQFTGALNLTTSQATVNFLRNGTDRFYGDFTPSGGACSSTSIINCNAGDYVEFSSYALGNCTVYGTNSLSGTTSPLFQATWLRPL